MKKKLVYSLLMAISFFLFNTQSVNAKLLSDDEQLIKVGIGAFSDGFYDIAEKQFSIILGSFPNHGKLYEVCYLLGNTYLKKGKLKEARSVFLKIIRESKHFENMDYALLRAAEVDIQLGNVEEAKKLLQSLIGRFPKFERIDYSYYLLGLLDFISNRTTQAESSFKKVSLLSKNIELIRSSLFWSGISSFKRNDFEAAVSFLQGLRDDPQYVPQSYRKYALFWLGEAQLKLGKFVDAKLSYKAFYELFKNDPLTPLAYWRLGFCEYRSGNIQESIEIFQSFKNQFKESLLILSTHYLLGEILLSQDHFSSSIKELNFIVSPPQENRLWGMALIALHWDHIHLGEPEEANKTFQRLQKLNRFEEEKLFIQWLNAERGFSEGNISDSLPYYFNMLNTGFREKSLFKIGKGYFLESKFREAITNFDILSLEYPNSSYIDEALFLKGECFVKLGDIGQAFETYDLILRQKRNSAWHPLSLIQVGSMNLSRNEKEAAEKAFRALTTEFQNHPLFDYAAFQLGHLYFKKNDIVEAIYYFSTVLKGKNSPLLGETYFSLGEILYQQGKYDKAFSHFQNAIPYLKENSLWFFLSQLEIGNLQRRWGEYEEAKKSFQIILQQSKDEILKQAVRELLNDMDSH